MEKLRVTKDQLSHQHNYAWNEFDSQKNLSKSLADRIVKELACAIKKDGKAVLALSGGSTPIPLLKELTAITFDWNKVVITLVDERWVPIGHELSNADLLLEYLLNDLTGPPKFVPLFNVSAAAMDASSSRIPVLTDYCWQTNSKFNNPAAFDVVILGMGNDGHTASFFPDAENINELVDAKNNNHLLSCSSPSTQVERITWSLPMLLNTNFLALHITSVEKKNVFNRAIESDDAKVMPIRSVIFQTETALQVYYAD